MCCALAPLSRLACISFSSADLSAEGSVLVAVSVTQAVIDRIKTKGGSSPLMETWLFGCPSDPEVVSLRCVVRVDGC
jgi:hypothetical protein